MSAPVVEHGVYIAALPVEDIFADPTYQRVLDVAHARRMAAGWDRRLAGIIEVSDRGPDASPRYAVVDGQHRWAAARFLAEPPQLVANVHEGLSVTGEAELFDRLNRQRKAITTWDHWKARRASGDLLVSSIETTVTNAGLKVSESAATVGGISCVSTLEKVAASAGGLELLAASLTILASAWGTNQKGVYEAPLVLGVALILDHFADRIDADLLIAALADTPPKRIRVDASMLRDHCGMSGSLGKLCAAAILNCYGAKAGGRGRLTFPAKWPGVLAKPRSSKSVAKQDNPQTADRGDAAPVPVSSAPVPVSTAPVPVATVSTSWTTVTSAQPTGPLTVPDVGPPRRNDDLAELIRAHGDTIWERASEPDCILADELGITERQVRRIRADLGIRP